MSNQTHSDIPKSGAGYSGFGQGALGASQGPFGDAIAAALGPQLGMQRAQLGGMDQKLTGQDNPMADAISGLSSATIPKIDLEQIFNRILNRPMQTGSVAGAGGVRPW